MFRFFLSLDIDVANPTQIHFKDHRECVAEPEDDGYSLTLKPPFNECGMESAVGVTDGCCILFIIRLCCI